MAICQWNMRGFNSNREQVRVLFKEYNLAAICLQEIKLGNVSPNVGHNFSFYKSPPPVGERAHGGAGIILINSLTQKDVQLDTILQACATQIFISKWITLCSLIWNPDLNPVWWTELVIQDRS